SGSRMCIRPRRLRKIISDPQVTQALDLLAPSAEPDVDTALQRQLALQEQARGSYADGKLQGARARFGALGGGLDFGRPVMVPIAAVLLLALALFAAPVRSLAAQLLTIFRVQDVTPITLEHVTQPLPDLSRFGDMTPAPRDVRMQPVQVANVAAASSQAGFTVRTPKQLPAGLPAEPSIVEVNNGFNLSFTFRAQKAAAYLASSGHKDVNLPPKFDGATLTLRVPPAVSLAYLPAGTSLTDVQQA